MKKSLLWPMLVALTAILPAPTWGADIPVTIYADEGYPPYSYDDNGKPAGIYYEIMKVALSRLEGYKVTIQNVPWKRGMQHLREGTGFALFPPYMNLIDEPWTWPYSLPLFQEKVVAMCREDIMTKPRPKWPEDYYGLTIGNNAGFIVGGAEFDKAVKEGKMKMQEAKDNEANIMKLALKRLDCYINDKLSILWTLNQLKKAGTYDEKAGHAKIVEGTTIAVEHGFLGYTDRDKSAFPFKTDFAKKFDTIIYQMYRRGEIERIGKEFMQSD